MTANRSTRPVLPHVKKITGVRVLPYAVRKVNKHSQNLFVAATGWLLPVDALLRLIASHPPIKGTIDLMQLSFGSTRSLSIQEKYFLSE
jgi:hypothetical protein